MTAHYRLETLVMRLYEYDYRMNLRLTEAVLAQPEPSQECLKFLSHILLAQKVWQSRLEGKDPGKPDIWVTLPAEELADGFSAVSRDWMRFFKDLPEGEMQRMVEYTNLKGEPYRQRMEEILMHVVNHGTHHRGQVSLLLRQSGAQPPVTDFIAYTREGL